MHYSIAIAPNLDVDAREFAAAWNGAPEARALAEASVVTQPPRASRSILSWSGRACSC